MPSKWQVHPRSIGASLSFQEQCVMPDNVVSRLSHRSRTQLLYVASNQVQCCNAYLGAFGSGPAQGDLEQSRKWGADWFTFDVYGVNRSSLCRSILIIIDLYKSHDDKWWHHVVGIRVMGCVSVIDLPYRCRAPARQHPERKAWCLHCLVSESSWLVLIFCKTFFLESLAQWLWNVLKLCGWTQLLLKAFVAKCQKRGRWSLQIHLECLACTNKFAVFAVFAVLLLISGFNYWNLPRICNGLSFVNPTLCNWCLCNLCNTMIPLWSLCIFCQEHPRASKSRPRAVQEQSELPEACQRSVAEHRLQPHSQPKRLASANLNQHGNITTIHSCHISVPGSWG